MIIFDNQELRLIEGTASDYVSNQGNVYRLREGQFIPNTLYRSKNGYVYVYVCLTGVSSTKRTKRVHKLVAKAFLDNPNNYPIVGHKNNIKHDNRVENLYWTTLSENSQKAHDDKLIINDKGIEDSQSCPIACYDKQDNLISVYGSMSEAGRCIKNFPLHSISKVIGHGVGKKGYRFEYITKEFYYSVPENKRCQVFEVVSYNKIKTKILVTNFETGKQQIFDSQKQIEKELGYSQSIISRLIKSNKTKWGYKFERVL